MKKVLVAGATGYLGQFVVGALKAKGYWIRALGRSASKLAPVEEYLMSYSLAKLPTPILSPVFVMASISSSHR